MYVGVVGSGLFVIKPVATPQLPAHLCQVCVCVLAKQDWKLCMCCVCAAVNQPDKGPFVVFTQVLTCCLDHILSLSLTLFLSLFFSLALSLNGPLTQHFFYCPPATTFPHPTTTTATSPLSAPPFSSTLGLFVTHYISCVFLLHRFPC